MITWQYSVDTNLELIVRLLSQIMLRLGSSLGFGKYSDFLTKVSEIAVKSKNNKMAKQ